MSEKTAQAKPSVQADVRSENEAGAAQPEKFDLRSHTISEEKRRELLRLFPEVRTEGEKVDFNRLKLALGESVETGKERYGLTWPGKADCFKAIQTPSLGTLLPVPEESVNWDTTENLIIEGDNLEVLKLLQKSYMGRVKMIYIDPPYNTGNDFIYPDDYSESLQTYLEYTEQVDSQGKKFSTNSDTEGRFHSKWLNMMYPRLHLARSLLRADGVLWVSVDDGEVQRLRSLLDELFGEENFLATIVWQKKYAASNDAKGISVMHDYILAYQKSDRFIRNLLPRTEKQDRAYKFSDENGKGSWRPDNLLVKSFSESYVFPITNPNTGKEYLPPKGSCWRANAETVRKWIAEKRIFFGRDGMGPPQLKRYLSEVQPGIVPTTWWSFQEVGHNDEANKELRAVFEGRPPFETPKPTRLLRRIIEVSTVPGSGDVVLDFFAGSGTTAHAMLKANAEDGGNRRFILVQLPESTPEESEARRAGFTSISRVCEERVRRVIKQLMAGRGSESEGGQSMSLDMGFRIYKLSESNFKVWDSARPEHPDALQRRLTDHVHHVREGRSDQDILTEVLLKSGFPLTVNLSKVSVDGKSAFKVADGRLIVCLDRHLTLEAIRAIAEFHPERFVCLDEGFEGNDQLKVNAAQTFKMKGTVFQII